MIVSLIIISAKAIKATGNASLYAIFQYALGKTFKYLNPTQTHSVIFILNAFDEFGDSDNNKLAYILATAWHESKFISQPEIRCKPGTVCYDRQEKYWYTGFYGRGLPQITHKANYEKFGKLFKVDLVNNPDLALEPELSAKILVYGMMKGSFTGVNLERYINSSKQDFYNARRTVNVLDQAELISLYTLNILDNVRDISA